MKICLLSYRGNPYCGGQGIYITYLAKELVKQGHEVHVIAGPPYPEKIDGVIMHKIDNRNYFNNKNNFIDRDNPFASLRIPDIYEFIAAKIGIFPEMETFSIRAFLKIRELLRKFSFDIIHDNQCLGYGFLLLKNLGIPIISTIHHPLTIDRSTWFEFPSSFMIKMKRILYYPLIMHKYMANKMEKIITVSYDSAQQINKDFNVPMEKIRVIYNGMDSDIFYPLKNIKKKKNSIIFVGNVEDRKKGIIYLLKAISKTKNRVNLTIVDGGAPNRSFVPKWIDKFGINDRVHFTGKIPLERLIKLYSETEIAVTPSLYEGFGFPAAEAMACEVPVIAAEGGALPEVVGDHMKTGYLVPLRDSAALAEAIDFLLDNPKMRKDIGKAARRRILTIFTWEKASKEMVEVYRNVINAYSRF